MLYYWRAQKKRGGSSIENQKLQQAEMASLKRENESLGRGKCFFKKSGHVLHERIEVRYVMIKKNTNYFSVRTMCRLLVGITKWLL